MPIPEYCDPRAEEFFTRGFVGERHGENGTSYRISWDTTHEGLQPTLVLKAGNRRICAYCGNPALSIQSRSEGYPTIGHTCCCKGSRDELEHKEKLEALQARHEEEMTALMNEAPRPSKSVVEVAVSASARRIEQELLDRVDRNSAMVGDQPVGDYIAEQLDHISRF
ncbi:hypothetical protein [Neptuniibacter sp. QD37_11]|uniref:hypothetical protein n=1 Tax=Neptuniibacter sp. QD37_11 TaxID=3398209 RepID=UPI0039F56BB6